MIRNGWHLHLQTLHGQPAFPRSRMCLRRESKLIRRCVNSLPFQYVQRNWSHQIHLRIVWTPVHFHSDLPSEPILARMFGAPAPWTCRERRWRSEISAVRKHSQIKIRVDLVFPLETHSTLPYFPHVSGEKRTDQSRAVNPAVQITLSQNFPHLSCRDLI